tara:strand:+ start:11 stop:583 length:573 start_codon:yes stop_codon:yes gene_type:complete
MLTHVDCIGQTHTDILSTFLEWFIIDEKRPKAWSVPVDNPIMIIDGIHGITLYRVEQFQVQLFLLAPNVVIPQHKHPNVDSYEVGMWGVLLTHKGKPVLADKIENAMTPKEKGGKYSGCQNLTLRVRPDDVHGGYSGPKGGSFMSVQYWCDGIKPSSVETNWIGETLGDKHSKKLFNSDVEKSKPVDMEL